MPGTSPAEPPQDPALADLVAMLPTAWPDRMRRAVIDFGLLCVGIVSITMLPLRIHEGDGYWVALVVLACLAGLVGFAVASKHFQGRTTLTLWQAATGVVLVGIRRAGLPLVGLAFFALWTGIYVTLWLVHPGEAFTGLAAAPRVSDFFYYAVSAALLSTPQDIVASSRGVRAATLIEMLMGFAVLATYIASFTDWRATPR